MNNQPIQVLIVDHHAIVRKGMRALLNEYEDLRLVGEAEDGDQALELIERLMPDVVLIDLAIPGTGGIEVIKRIIAVQPTQRIIAMDAPLGEDLFPAAIKAGAQSCLSKDSEVEYLIQAIRYVYTKEILVYNFENALQLQNRVIHQEPRIKITVSLMEQNVGLCDNSLKRQFYRIGQRFA